MSLFIILFIILACLSMIDFLSKHNYGLFISAAILAVVAGIRITSVMIMALIINTT